MRHFSRRMFLAAGTAGAMRPVSGAPVLPRPASELTITTNSGEQVHLSQLKGRLIALEILLTTCPHCQRCSRTMQKMVDEFGSKGFTVLGAAVNDGARNSLVQFQISTGATYPIGVADRDKAYAFLQADLNAGPIYMPQLVFIDRKFTIRVQYAGTDPFFLEEEKNVRETILKMLQGGNPPIAPQDPRGGH